MELFSNYSQFKLLILSSIEISDRKLFAWLLFKIICFKIMLIWLVTKPYVYPGQPWFASKYGYTIYGYAAGKARGGTCYGTCNDFRPLHQDQTNSSSSSSMSSQDILLSPFSARSWPEAFHAAFIHCIQRKREDRIGWRRSIGTTISTTTTTPRTLTEQRLGEERRQEEPRKLSHTFIHVHSVLDQ